MTLDSICFLLFLVIIPSFNKIPSNFSHSNNINNNLINNNNNNNNKIGNLNKIVKEIMMSSMYDFINYYN